MSQFAKKLLGASIVALALTAPSMAPAADLEVTHWWTSKGESAAVAEFARIFEEQTGNHWVDSALSGSGTGANPIIIGRIRGGKPPGATQMNTGRDAEELIKAGYMRDLTPIADELKIKDFYADKALLEPCTFEGKIYCFPVNIHSWDWLWLSTAAYKKINTPVPTNWNEYVASFPKLREAGIIPFGLATGWPIAGIPGVLQADVGGKDLVNKIFREKSVDAVRSPEFHKFAEALDNLRSVLEPSEMVPLFADVGVQLVKGEAAGNIHGDWLQGDLQVLGGVPGENYECLPALGLGDQLSGGGDSFFFPKLPDGTDQAVIDAQTALAKIVIGKDAQLAFNLKKGSMPIRTDIDLTKANPCMKKALALLKNGLLPTGDLNLSSDTQQQMQDLSIEFINDKSITMDDYINRYADILSTAQ